MAVHRSDQKLNFTIAIPAFNAGRDFKKMLKSCNQQFDLHEILVVDSGSTDGTIEIAEAAGARIIPHPSRQFNHGLTRNELLNAARTKYVIFMTQDALLFDNIACQKLVEFTLENNLAAAYGKQLPRSDASFTEQFLRADNYQSESYIVCKYDSDRRGFKKIFSSNSFCVYDRELLLQVGGFRSTHFGEDALAFLDFYKAGLSFGYCAESSVVHSHSYNFRQELMRNIQIGRFRRNTYEEVERLCGLDTSGSDHIKAILKEASKNLSLQDMLACLLYITARGIGYTMGRNGF